jgi:hypothetical protein
MMRMAIFDAAFFIIISGFKCGKNNRSTLSSNNPQAKHYKN